MQQIRGHEKDENRIIIHFDYDAFYASVVENENPALKTVPLAIQQKQIIVTCNYEARRKGLHKLQLITEAKRVCPEVVIVLGEDLTRFRNASKDLYNFLRARIWSDRAERLGFDEVWLDCTDMVDYNYTLLNSNDLHHSFFCIDRDDPTQGFDFDASTFFGPTYPKHVAPGDHLSEEDRILQTRLILGSHLAKWLRHEVESQKGYTSTVGIATNKILSKLVGNVNKPRNQTTLQPPLGDNNTKIGNVHLFLDDHDIGKIPGLGFKLAQKVRASLLGREAAHETGLVYGGTKENVTVHQVRLHPAMGPEKLEHILGGPGSQKGIGGRIWDLINGIDHSEVDKAKRVPSQISQEDSYMKYLSTFDQVRHQLFLLSERLIRRMHVDLMEDEHDQTDMATSNTTSRRWLAHPRTLRLTTRPRPALNADGSRTRTFNRISHSVPLPNFVFGLVEATSILADKLVDTTLVHMFRKLHPERHGWNLSLINIAVSNMAETAADSKDSEGRDIGRMFRRQEEVLKDFRVVIPHDAAFPSDPDSSNFDRYPVSEPADFMIKSGSLRAEGEQEGADEDWQFDDQAEAEQPHHCHICGVKMPQFAVEAHYRFHSLSE